jgi:hypothetical protein
VRFLKGRIKLKVSFGGGVVSASAASPLATMPDEASNRIASEHKNTHGRLVIALTVISTPSAKKFVADKYPFSIPRSRAL